MHECLVNRCLLRLMPVSVVLGACTGLPPVARTNALDPPTAREEAAVARAERQPCSRWWGFIFPGIAQLCGGDSAEGVALVAVAAADIAAVAALGGNSDPNASTNVIPAIALTDAYLYSWSASAVRASLGERELYASQDSLAELISAPFNLDVLREPTIWAGLLIDAGVAIGLGIIINHVGNIHAGDPANIFGAVLDPPVGYPLAGAALTGLYEHVAIGEETFYRGFLQSSFSRSIGETAGWLLSDAMFGATHILNISSLPSKDRETYLAVSVPYITLSGLYLGWLYRHHGYRLVYPVAEHFWYDFALSAVDFALDPRHSQLAAHITVPF